MSEIVLDNEDIECWLFDHPGCKVEDLEDMPLHEFKQWRALQQMVRAGLIERGEPGAFRATAKAMADPAWAEATAKGLPK